MIKVFPERVCGEAIRLEEFIPYEILRYAIIYEGMKAGLPLEVEVDEMKPANGIMSLAAKVEPCVVVYNAQHRRDYYSFILTETMQSKMAYLIQYLGGDSKNTRKSETGSGLFRRLVMNRLNEENVYYDAVSEVLTTAIARLEVNGY